MNSDQYFSWDFVQVRDKYFDDTMEPVLMVKLDNDTNFFSRETQLKQYMLEDEL